MSLHKIIDRPNRSKWMQKAAKATAAMIGMFMKIIKSRNPSGQDIYC